MKAWAKPSLLISDSMFTYLPEMRNTQLQAIAGLKSDRLITKLRNRVVSCYGVKNVIVHVGTNDIYNFSVARFDYNIRAVISEIRKCNTECIIFLSSILPRPVDFMYSKELVSNFNQALQNIADSLSYVRYMACDKLFYNKYRQPIGVLFSADRLHLSTTGLNKIFSHIANTLAHAHDLEYE